MKKSVENGKVVRISRRFVLFMCIFFISLSGITLVLHIYIDKAYKKPVEADPPGNVETPSALSLIRENDNELIHKLYLADVETESSKYFLLKEDLSKMISQYTGKGTIQSVSVYFRYLNDGSWMSIDGDRLYMPGSLIKVPIMMYFLKMEQVHKGTLNKELLYEKPKQNFPSQVFKGDSILSGKKYKISDLLRYMIVESDNNATHLLSHNLENDPFCKIFTDLDIPPDKINDINYQISPKDYSKFLRVLYSSTYLHRTTSEYALELLAKCKFNQGITRNLPKDIIVAHKFGEAGRNYDMDFCESAIVYRDHGPYQLTIMTKGTQIQEQIDLVSKISEHVFHFLESGDNK